jgi:phosphate-selective porin OprO/OprP
MKETLDFHIKIIFISVLILIHTPLFSQVFIEDIKGREGLNIASTDDACVNIMTRFQAFSSFQTELDRQDMIAQSTPMMNIARARIRLNGYMHSPKWVYDLEFGLSDFNQSDAYGQYDALRRNLFDAVVKYIPNPNLGIWVGQAMLPGNRERSMYSSNLQFIDRSILTHNYALDRDFGIQVRSQKDFNGIIVRNALAITSGQGRNYAFENKGGYAATVRFELLPLGNFTGLNELYVSDIEREEKPKLAVGVNYDYHDNAYRSQGRTGLEIPYQRDMESFHADLLFKYKGISFLAEFADRYAPIPVVYANDLSTLGIFNIGHSWNFQSGYVFTNMWEIAARYTQVNPVPVTRANVMREYTLGISKFIAANKLKVQSDFGYRQMNSSPDEKLIFRLMLEMGI